MEMFEQVLHLIGITVLTGGGVSLIVYQAFKHLAVKWLDARFEERLQALKHQHGKEIEELRFKISAMLDRAVKLHQREFEVLPEAWSKLNDAFWNARGFVSPFQSYPDIDRMIPQQQEDFITSCRLLDWQKIELRLANNKNEFYQQHIFWQNLNDARTKSQDAYTYLIKNGIFINDEIRAKFTVIHDLVWKALIEHQHNVEDNIRPRLREDIGTLLKEGEGLMKELERSVHQRLWPVDGGPLTIHSSGPAQ